jgi:hypothetical protein
MPPNFTVLFRGTLVHFSHEYCQHFLTRKKPAEFKQVDAAQLSVDAAQFSG